MAENLNKVNMSSVYVFSLLCLLAHVESRDEHIPVLIWSSPDFQIKKNVDYLAFDKIKSDSFEFYMLSLLEDKNPTIVIFLEQFLGINDFDWTNKSEKNPFPFLTELITASKLSYFRGVKAPHQALTRLSKKGYSWTHLKLGQSISVKEGSLLFMEFRKIDGDRVKTLTSHDEAMKNIHHQLANSGKSWICVYTARHSDKTRSDLDKKLSSWHVDEQFVKKGSKAVSMYHDEHTGFALITRGSIELYLPSLNKTTYKPLDNYLRASATFSHKKLNFVIWFLNYKLTFHLNQENHRWTIQEAKIVNDNGDTLELLQQNEKTPDKCYTHVAEFKSVQEPIVKVKLNKYMFLKLPQLESCVKPYRVELMALFIFFAVVFIIVVWNSVLESYDFSAESKASIDKILAFKFDTSF